MNNDRNDTLPEDILNFIHAGHNLFTSKLIPQLQQKYSELSPEKIQNVLVHMEHSKQVNLTKVPYYKVVGNRFEKRMSVQINLNSLKCIEIIQPMVDLLKNNRTAFHIAEKLSINRLCGTELSRELHIDKRIIYQNIHNLENHKIIKVHEYGFKGSKTYRITFYGMYAVTSTRRQNNS